MREVTDLKNLKELLEKYSIDEIDFENDQVKRMIEKYGVDILLVYGNPEIKELNRAFERDMSVGMHAGNGSKLMFTTEVNMAEYLTEKLGEEELLKICLEYGKTLNQIDLVVSGDEVNRQAIREKLDKIIYENIKGKGMPYDDNLPENFKIRHPELFLSKKIDLKLRKKFYCGTLDFDDIRKNPQLIDALVDKDLEVGFGELMHKRSIA